MFRDGPHGQLDGSRQEGDPPGMADSEVRVMLDPETQRRLAAAAEIVGRSIDDHARELIVEGLQHDSWAEDVRIAEEVDRTGVSYSVAEGLADFDAAVKTRFEAPR